MALIEVTAGGAGERLLVLLHGMGATGDVWRGLVEVVGDVWDGRWVAVDLPGHGRAGAPAVVSYASCTTPLVGLLEDERDVTVLGHSFGGVLGLALAAGPTGPRVTRVVGLGIKCVWSEEELAGAAAVAARPMRVFATREEAVDRALKVAGLDGLVDPDDERFAATAVVQAEDGWRPRFNPRLLAVGAPPMRTLLDNVRPSTRVTLARGEHDHMVTTADLAALVPDPVVLPGLGHNAHVEDPAAVARLLA